MWLGYSRHLATPPLNPRHDSRQFANVIVLNKVSTIPDIEARRVRAAIEALNPGALVVSADYGQVPLENILNTKVGRGLF